MALSIPNSLVEAGRRMKQNVRHYRSSYAIFILFMFILSLFGLSFPMVILINFVFGCFLIYLYDADANQIVLSNCCAVDTIAVLAVLGVFSIWILFLIAGVWLNVLVSILIASALAGLHALFTRLDHRDDQEPEYHELLEVVIRNPTTTTPPTASHAHQEPTTPPTASHAHQEPEATTPPTASHVDQEPEYHEPVEAVGNPTTTPPTASRAHQEPQATTPPTASHAHQEPQDPDLFFCI